VCRCRTRGCHEDIYMQRIGWRALRRQSSACISEVSTVGAQGTFMVAERATSTDNSRELGLEDYKNVCDAGSSRFY